MKKVKLRGVCAFPGGAVNKNPPARAGGHGLTRVREESTCWEQLSPHEGLRAKVLKPVLRSEKPEHHNE